MLLKHLEQSSNKRGPQENITEYRKSPLVHHSYRASYVVQDEKTAMLLVDPMRRTILNLLADEAYTQSQLAEIVGLADASIGHHIKILVGAKLVRVVRREEEVHGIMQNFYRSIALCIVVDTENMPKSVSKYFFPINIERIRGAISALDGKKRKVLAEFNTRRVEEMAENLAVSIAREAKKLGVRKTLQDRGTVTAEIYRRALKETLRHFTTSADGDMVQRD